jgi:hypothetical protein
MDPTDLHLIRPVTGLQKPASVAATGRRDERRRRQSRHDSEEDGTFNEVGDENETPVSPTPPVARDDDPHTIDFCA